MNVTKRCRVHLAVALPSRCGSNIADEASGCGAVMLRVDLETEKAVRAKSNRQSNQLSCSDLQTSGVGIANIGGPCAR
jgi:hypothetical protein